jgi:hypothetical protein
VRPFPRLLAFAIALLATAAAVAPAAAEILKREPAMGKLKLGQRVLVDDGRCPKGQIMEVIGGDHVKAGGTQNIERTRRCIPRR